MAGLHPRLDCLRQAPQLDCLGSFAIGHVRPSLNPIPVALDFSIVHPKVPGPFRPPPFSSLFPSRVDRQLD